MDDSRRNFIKIAGGAVVLAAAGVKAVGHAAEGESGPVADLPPPQPPVEATPSVVPADGRVRSDFRWAMVVDIRKCKEGCTDCIQACHLSHNVPSFPKTGDAARWEVKWIWTTSFEEAFTDQSHEYLPHFAEKNPSLVLCNHCDNPPCVRACPTQATFKRPDGIVMMDFHRCIGCRFCVSACPYGSRNLNFAEPRPYVRQPNSKYPMRMRGVVEKCTFCEEQLAQGKLPLCVSACKYGALTFGNIKDPESKVSKLLDEQFSLRRKPNLGTKPMVFYLV